MQYVWLCRKWLPGVRTAAMLPLRRKDAWMMGVVVLGPLFLTWDLPDQGHHCTGRGPASAFESINSGHGPEVDRLEHRL
jgi:hypothetical protein